MPGHVKSHRGFVEGLKTEGTEKECTAVPRTLSPDRDCPVRGMSDNSWQLGSCPNIYNKASVSQGFL